MGVISFKSKGDFSKTERFLKKASTIDFHSILRKYGERGVQALAAATPKNTGITANSWSYEITASSDSISISFNNSETISNGTPLVILLQYGHGTRNGGYVKGIDFINPAIQPIFDQIAEEAWQEVRKS